MQKNHSKQIRGEENDDSVLKYAIHSKTTEEVNKTKTLNKLFKCTILKNL